MIGIVLLFLNNFYWFQLNRTLGPIATTLMRVIHDVLKVAFAYLIFLVAFGTGIHLVLNNAVYGYEKCDDDDVRICFQNGLMTLYSSLDSIDCLYS